VLDLFADFHKTVGDVFDSVSAAGKRPRGETQRRYSDALRAWVRTRTERPDLADVERCIKAVAYAASAQSEQGFAEAVFTHGPRLLAEMTRP